MSAKMSAKDGKVSTTSGGLEDEIARLKVKLENAETNRDEAKTQRDVSKRHEEDYQDARLEVTRISQQLHDAVELLKLEKNPQQASSTDVDMKLLTRCVGRVLCRPNPRGDFSIAGTCCVISLSEEGKREALVVTAYHVVRHVRDKQSCVAVYFNGVKHEAQVTLFSKKKDIAILSFQSPTDNELRSLVMSTDVPHHSTTLMLVHFPPLVDSDMQQISASQGLVNDPSIHFGNLVLHDIDNTPYAYGSWDSFPGSSGGAVVDLITNELVGIHLSEVYHGLREDAVSVSTDVAPSAINVDSTDSRRTSVESTQSNTSESSTECQQVATKKRRITINAVTEMPRSRMASFMLSTGIIARFGDRLPQSSANRRSWANDALYD